MKQFLFLSTILLTISLNAQQLKSPSEFLGYELGSQFTRHHEVVDYYEYLAKNASDRVQLKEYGKTNERRPLLLAYVSSAANIKNLENIRTEHLKSTTGESSASKSIVWLSYNVHGNESVSTEASMQTIYELLTTKSNYLENTVVIMDPCINPDGRDRYVNWYNQYKNTPNNIDPNSKEHHEGWWSGRSNHYMFDLNRDWAWLTQIESQNRLKVYNKWMPHVHVDFHEQGVDSPYYFAPASEPYHEVITPFQREFQTTIGKNHAKYFDANGWFYFTKEVFDLLYPSYGDTYPIYNGGIGMTYEQGGSGRAGLGIITSIGDTLTLKDRLDHHRTTGLSTVEVAASNASKLNQEFQKFYRNKNYKYKSYVMNGDEDRIDALTQLLDKHEIEYGWGKSATIKGFKYSTGKTGSLRTSENSLVVSTDQTKSTLVKVLFEPNAKLSDSVTYDITAWSLPYAYGLDAMASQSLITSTAKSKKSISNGSLSSKAYAFMTEWNSMKDAKFLAELIQNKIKVRHSYKPFTLEGKSHKRGTLIITKGDNKNNDGFLKTLVKIANKHQIELTPTSTGFVDSGKDFGSRYVQMINAPKIAVLSGEPTSTLRFGEIWYFFEQQLNYPMSVIDSEYMAGVDLSKYDIIILPGGFGYKGFLKEDKLDGLKDWVSNGGKLIAMGDAINGLTGEDGFGIKTKEVIKDTSENMQIFDEGQREYIKQTISGAIFKTKVDNTHPLAYGYDNSYFSLKLGADAYDYLDSGSVVYLEEGNNKPIAGFAGSEAQSKIEKSLVFGVSNHGSGQVIYMVDNPLFRGFWENGKLLFSNALFMVN
ncbi:M14 family metallopeptidase [Maribacter sp. HTCC2170]|uniref:M14 family metallopeptidase n=1 Tax=Maribacter sp. (strain HTCC2170 / KCCM 42371) TaxID=313603 RepID=UPI00006ADA4D|nr:M14 family metallopeptidase [Maribacter sp. HTCC2170]EAQ99819.1 secreted protein containing N-terminal zinc-dependent carboxypeptidase related domain, putative [Maribacter sp. HTCC2170]